MPVEPTLRHLPIAPVVKLNVKVNWSALAFQKRDREKLGAKWEGSKCKCPYCYPPEWKLRVMAFELKRKADGGWRLPQAKVHRDSRVHVMSTATDKVKQIRLEQARTLYFWSTPRFKEYVILDIAVLLIPEH